MSGDSSQLLPVIRGSPSAALADAVSTADGFAAGDDDFVELPGLAALPSLISKARQRLEDKDKGKRAYELLSPAQLKEAKRHVQQEKIANAGGQRALPKPPRLVSTDGVHFFSSMRVLNFYERTKNNIKKQKALVATRASNFTERDLYTFKHMWLEKDKLESDISSMREEIIAKGKKLDCNCRASQSRSHKHAAWCRKRLRTKLAKEDRAKELAYAFAVNNQGSGSELDDSGDIDHRKKSLLDLPRAEDMHQLSLRHKFVPPLSSFHTRDALVQDMHILKWINLLIPEAAEVVNAIADDREEQARIEKEEQKRKREELQAMADAVAAAAQDSSSSETEGSENDLSDEEGEAVLDKFNFKSRKLQDRAKCMLPEGVIDVSEDQAESSSDNDSYPSAHESDFENEFEKDAGAKKVVDFDRNFNATEQEHIATLMQSAIVRVFQGPLKSVVPSTWLRYVSELGELVPKQVYGRARLVDLTGSEGALAVLTALWSCQFESITTFEDGYEKLIIAMHFVDATKKVVLGEVKGDNSDSDSSTIHDSDVDLDGYHSELENPPKDEYDERFRAFCRAHQKVKTKNIVCISESHTPSSILNRLNTVKVLRRSWNFDEPHMMWKDAEVWQKADVLLIDEQKLWLGNGCLRELDQVMSSPEWVNQEYTSDAIRELSRVYLGIQKIEKKEFTILDDEEQENEIQILRQKLEEVRMINDPEALQKIVRANDANVCDSLELKASLLRRRELSNSLSKCKPGTLVAVLRPYPQKYERLPSHRKCPETEAKKDGELMPLKHAKWGDTSRGHVVDDDSGDDSEDVEETEEEALYRERKEKYHQQMQERLDQWRLEDALMIQENDSSDTMPSADASNAKYSRPDHSIIVPSYDENPKYDSSCDSTSEHAVDRVDWSCPDPVVLRDRWFNEPLLLERQGSPFFKVSSNFVFNGVKLKLWEGGGEVDCVLYQRRAPSSICELIEY